MDDRPPAAGAPLRRSNNSGGLLEESKDVAIGSGSVGTLGSMSRTSMSGSGSSGAINLGGSSGKGSFSLRGTWKKSRSSSSGTLGKGKRGGKLRESPEAKSHVERAELMRKRLEELFDRYKSTPEDPEDVEDLELSSGEIDAMGPNGISLFLSDLGFGEDDVIGFVVAWKLGCKHMGRITRSEWVSGLMLMGCDSVAAVRAFIPQLEIELKAKGREIFVFAFQVSRASNAKTLDLPSACILLKLFLPAQKYGHTEPFVDWITSHQSSYRSISKDQWDNLYDFSHHVKSDLSNYDEDEGWPCLLDEYVQWRLNGDSTTNCAEGC